ncbi:MAG: hypothetical protein O2973_10735 [Gemmatimonadetes bacterium]|nr:hypothetical protein [Gemmatimonadota bacterium]
MNGDAIVEHLLDQLNQVGFLENFRIPPRFPGVFCAHAMIGFAQQSGASRREFRDADVLAGGSMRRYRTANLADPVALRSDLFGITLWMFGSPAVPPCDPGENNDRCACQGLASAI